MNRLAPLAMIAALVLASVGMNAVADDAMQPGWVDTDRPNCQVWVWNLQRDLTVTWSGACANGKAQGSGKQTTSAHDANGEPISEFFEGVMVDGKSNGKGTCRFADGSRYEGDWKDHMMDGHGAYTYAGGGRYEGAWKANKKSGQGMLIFPDGSSYRGDFEDNSPHGIGYCEAPDSVGRCEFVHGSFARWMD